MRSIQQIFNIIFVSSVILLSSNIANGQVLQDMYRFLELEVVDSDGKPLADATVDLSGKLVAADAAVGTLKTNKRGRLENGLRVNVNKGVSPVGFSVLKPGYYTFVDYFGIIASRERWENPTRLELLIVPKTAAERAVVGDEQIKRELFIAAKTGDAANVRKLLKTGLDPNLTTTDLRGVPGEKDVPVIVYAASSGDGETVGELLRAGANVRKTDEPTRGVLATYLNVDLYYTLYFDHPAKAERAVLLDAFDKGAEDLIRAGADIKRLNAGRNFLNSQKETMLMTAAAKGCVRAARLLIKKGVPVNAIDEYGATALMYAVRGYQDSASRLALINLLLESGANINAVTRDDGGYYNCQTALMLAVGSRDLETIKFLIKNGASLNPPCKSGETPLKIAKSMLGGVYATEVRQIIKLLEAAGAK